MNKLNYKKIILFIFLFATLSSLGNSTWHYIQNKRVLNSQNSKNETIKFTDLTNLRKIPDNLLEKEGFNKDELLILNNRRLNNLKLIEILATLDINQDKKEILSYSKNKHSAEGNIFTNLVIEPVEVIFLPKEDETYLKLNYTTSIEEPLYSRTKGFMVIENNWNYIFGLTKLNYYTSNGEIKTIYKANLYNNYTYSDFSKVIIDFNFIESWTGKTFYLKEISGLTVLRKRGHSDISSFVQIKQKNWLTQKDLTKHWFDYSLH